MNKEIDIAELEKDLILDERESLKEIQQKFVDRIKKQKSVEKHIRAFFEKQYLLDPPVEVLTEFNQIIRCKIYGSVYRFYSDLESYIEDGGDIDE